MYQESGEKITEKGGLFGDHWIHNKNKDEKLINYQFILIIIFI